ncbi:MAG: DNA-directed RNA polymerase subunit omega [Planctomycetaceae bacterium]|nr:DNA-directed RNA polymerase subunit omega [Planctomycetaceae bacterium]MCA9108873.1 DNA-directed RNA polymerase subunit omega [Planctomycetaceae bacterium]
MLEELKEEQIVRKVGGRFKLSTLIQKRLVQLNRGARPLVDVVGKPGMHTVIEEIMHDKIFLDQSENVVFAVDDAPDVDGDLDGGPSLDDI